MILLDTNTLIHYLKGRDSVVSRLQATPPTELGIPSVVAYEVGYGTRKSGSARRQSVISGLLANISIVAFDLDAAQEAARIRVELEAHSWSIGPMDLLIAGTAVSRSAVLVTCNTKEFSRIRGLRLEDWTS